MWHRGLLLLIVTALMAGCAYSARSVITVTPAPDAVLNPQAEVQWLDRELQRHHDGCFAPHRAQVTQTLKNGSPVLLYRVNSSSVELSIRIDPEHGVVARLSEWMERAFSGMGGQCYVQVLQVLQARYGDERLRIEESCRGRCLR